MVVDGVLNINKPKGITSFEVVARLKNSSKIKKVGHSGTLDPEACGVLPVCLGKATRIVPFLMETSKEYRATLHLGIATDTQDATGTILYKAERLSLSQEQILEVLGSFVGEIEQIPPMYSALKHQGNRLYELAREGIEVERRPRKIKIYHLSMNSYDPPYINFDVCCSKGTYIRTLCADIGERLGVGGHMHSLQRLRVGEFGLEEAIPFETITWQNIHDILTSRIYSLDQALKFLPVVQIKPEAERKVSHGISLSSQEVMRYSEEFQSGSFQGSDPHSSGLQGRILESRALQSGDLFRGHNQKGDLVGVFEAIFDQADQAKVGQAIAVGAGISQMGNLWFKPKRIFI